MNLLHEQDSEAAHCYLTEEFDVNENDILFDVGSAEGIFPLSVIDRVKQIILFEVEDKWIEPLRKTFEPWGDKVRIINKYVSDADSDVTIKIDTVVKSLEAKSIFLKLDVEGAEKSVIEGAKETLASESYSVKLAVCTYHNQDDYEDLRGVMLDKKYRVDTSKGYMLFIYDDLKPPYFRRGMIYCKK